MSSPRVLSIQSHIVSGYCGNKAATFPLQLLGFDVDVMNTVSFSNHTGYPSWTGEKATGDQLTKLFEGLETNGLVDYTHLLTGYIGSAQNLTAVASIIERLQDHGQPFFVLDPVMGDHDQLYVQPDVIPIYKGLLKFAKAITPNQFEAEILADKKITDIQSCLEVIDILHKEGVEHVILTSVTLSIKDIQNCSRSASSSTTTNRTNGGVTTNGSKLSEENDSNDKDDKDSSHTALYCVCSSSTSSTSKPRAFAIGFPTYDGYFTGTGDLFSALLVARLHEALKDTTSQNTLPALTQACLKVVATMKAVVLRTYLTQKGTPGRSLDRTQASASQIVKRCELRLIQSKPEIEHPDLGGVHAIEIFSLD
ncbi:pyridoxine kinase [Entomortierella parvispora]|uniref:pyridoxal kinase n=1 Tax=Entomortierella parvispora TaxID=205924 RepID=A0A9P3HGU3_9FUNG|nr:pyridoxine kinase [Entomortierella parvispora]